MGVSYTASAVIGARVKESDFYRTERVKAFDHDHSPEWTHDPTSGKPLWEDVMVPAFGDNVESLASAAGLGVFEAGYSENEDSDVFIGVGVGVGASYYGDESCVGYLPLLDNLGDISRKLKAFLEPHGLWDEKSFGLYSLLYAC